MTWLGFGAPLWLAGLAALTLPVAIHLLSRGRQRRLPIGSVRWLAAAQTLRARRLRPSRWWLLALRCLLLTAVVMALAAPRFALPEGTEADRWLLIEPEIAAHRARLEPDQPSVFGALDDAIAAGAEARWLAPGLPRADLDAPPPPSSASLWSLLVEADREAPRGAEWTVVTMARAAQLGGSRPSLARSMEWVEIVDPAPNRWLARVLGGSDIALELTVATSDRSETRFDRVTVPTAPGPDETSSSGAEVLPTDAGLAIEWTEGGSLEGDDGVVLDGTRGTLAAAILVSPQRQQDARYVGAGFEAAARAVGRTLRLVSLAAGDEARVPEGARVVFWLAPEPVPEELLQGLASRGGILVSDALERFEDCDRELRPEASPRSLRVDRCGPVDRRAAGVEAHTDEGAEQAVAVLWAGGSGRPLLSGERHGRGLWLRFASRFNPGWTDLVLAPEFASWMVSVLERAAPEAASSSSVTSDRRSAGDQALPRSAARPASAESTREVPLSAGFWLQVLLLAVVERWWALRGAR